MRCPCAADARAGEVGRAEVVEAWRPTPALLIIAAVSRQAVLEAQQEGTAI